MFKNEKINNFFNRKNARKFLFGTSLLLATISISTLSIIIAKTFSGPINPYTNEYEKNQAEVNKFVDTFEYNDEKLIVPSNFNNSFKVVDVDGNTITDRAGMLVSEAYENNMFVFDCPTNIEYWARQQGISVSFEKYNPNSQIHSAFPSYSNSTYPNFLVSFSKGEGVNKYSRYYNVGTTSIYGFRKTKNQELIETLSTSYLNDNDKISLQDEFYKDPSNHSKGFRDNLYAKNITNENVVLDLSGTYESINWKVQNTYQYADDPRKLRIIFEFSLGTPGIDEFKDTYFEVIWNQNFDLDQGVDDAKSRIKIFLDDPQHKENFEDSYTIKKIVSADDNPWDLNGYTVTQIKKVLIADKKNYVTNFNPPSSNKNAASEKGLYYFIDESEPDFIRTKYNNPNEIEIKIWVSSKTGSFDFYKEYFYTKVDFSFKTSDVKDKANRVEGILNDWTTEYPEETFPLSFTLSKSNTTIFNNKTSQRFIDEDYQKGMDLIKESNPSTFSEYLFSNEKQIGSLKFNFPCPFIVPKPSSGAGDQFEVQPQDINVEILNINQEINKTTSLIINTNVYYGDINVDAYSFGMSFSLEESLITSNEELSNDIWNLMINDIKCNPNGVHFSLTSEGEKATFQDIQELYNSLKSNSLGNYLKEDVFYIYSTSMDDKDDEIEKIKNNFGAPIISFDDDLNQIIDSHIPKPDDSGQIVFNDMEININNNWLTSKKIPIKLILTVESNKIKIK